VGDADAVGLGVEPPSPEQAVREASPRAEAASTVSGRAARPGLTVTEPHLPTGNTNRTVKI